MLKSLIWRGRDSLLIGVAFLSTLSACASRTFHSSPRSENTLPESRLQWGWSQPGNQPVFVSGLKSFLEAEGHANARAQAARVCQRFTEEREIVFKAISGFRFERVLPTSPEYISSQTADKELDVIFHAAACSATSSKESESNEAFARAETGISTWMNVYRPVGNPINEARLIRLLQSIDLTQARFPFPLREKATTFAKDIISKQDRFYEGKTDAGTNPVMSPAKDSRTWNNWQTWRLAMRATASTMLGDRSEQEKTRTFIAESFPRNLPPDNPGFDFIHRDAIHYHHYNLQAWLIIAWFTPDLLSNSQLTRIEAAFLFLKPFYEGTEKHIEFEKSTVPFDIERREAGIPEYQNKPWQPESANRTLRLARCIFPSLRQWTTQLDRNKNEAPYTKLLAALGCEAE